MGTRERPAIGWMDRETASIDSRSEADGRPGVVLNILKVNAGVTLRHIPAPCCAQCNSAIEIAEAACATRCKLDQYIDITASRIEVVPQDGPEQFQLVNAVKAAQVGNCIAVLLDQWMHGPILSCVRMATEPCQGDDLHRHVANCKQT